MSFWGELQRRNVFKVGVAYVIVAWLIAQVANTFFPLLNLPEWTTTFVAVLLILGFPIALIHAWAYELTPDGIKRTKEVPLAESITHLTGKKLNCILVGVIVLAVAYILFDNLYLDRRVVEPEMVTTITEKTPSPVEVEETKKTIAVLPFDDLSPEKDQEYFVLGLSEEILNSLAQIEDLTVIAKTSSFSFKGTSKTIQEIADVLGVKHILEGSVRKSGNSLRITAQLIRAEDGGHLWSKTYNRELNDIFAVQEDIAKTVSGELKVTLGIGKSFKQLGGTYNVEAYEHYLFAQGLWNKALVDKGEILGKLNSALESVDIAIELDPEFALAWAYKSLIHVYLSMFGSVKDVTSQQEVSLYAARRAIEIEPNLPEGHYWSGYILGSKGNLIAAGSFFKKAFKLNTKPVSWDNEGAIAIFYLSVGYFEKALELLEEMVQNDPLNLEVRGFYLLTFGLLGDMERAEKEFERGRALFGNEWLWGNVFITELRLGEKHPVTREDILTFQSHTTEINVAKEHLESPEEGLAALRRVYDNYPGEMTSRHFFVFSWFAAYFGDSQFALDLMEKAAEINALDILQFWPSLYMEVRKLPRFKELIRQNGLVDYWNEFGWPDLCRPLDNGDFVCD